MKTYPIEKYKFYTTKTKDGRMKTIATSTYAGKTVRGVAICDHEDTYNEEVGKKIAAARCAVKVAEKRYFRAASKAEAACNAVEAARQFSTDMDAYLYDAGQALLKAQEDLYGVVHEC